MSLPADLVRLGFGLTRHALGGAPTPSAHQALIRLFCRSGGGSNDRLARWIARVHPPYRLASRSGVLGDMSGAAADAAVAALDEHGYRVFERALPDDACERLMRFACSAACTIRSDGAAPAMPAERYERDRPLGVRYDLDAPAVLAQPDVQALLCDDSILELAQRYLRCKPVIDTASMWWHTAHSQLPDANAAQLFHFDMDRIKWLKVFVYLTDVGPGNGPHEFVAGSQRTGAIPAALLQRGYRRLGDAEVAAAFAPERLRSFIGWRGTIIVEDTRGLHKGAVVRSGDRLMLQLQFSNSGFGASMPRNRIPAAAPALAARATAMPRLFSRCEVGP